MTRPPQADTADVATLRAVLPPEVPYPGFLVGGAAPHYRVRAEDCPAAVWRASSGAHLLGADDIDTDDDVTSIILPRLAGRLDTSVRREGLTDGEAVTIAVSLIRGAAQALAEDITDGSWWVTQLGRPVLAPGGGEAWREATRGLLNQLAGARPGPFAEAARDALEALSAEHGFVARAAAFEDRLFSFALPQPVDSLPSAAATADGPVAVSARVAVHPPSRVRSSGARAHAQLWDGIARLVDAGIARSLADAVDRTRQWLARRTSRGRAARPRPRRRMLLLVAMGAVTATLAVGLSWPTDESSTGADGGGDAPAASAGAPGASTPVGTEAGPGRSQPADPTPGTAPGGGPVDAPVETRIEGPVDVASATLANLTSCLADVDSGCLAGVAERADAVFPPGAATTEGEQTITLLDDLGGVLVVRVEATDEPAQIAVIVQADEKGLVRDIYDVADQP